MKAYVGQVICNGEGEIIGRIVRISRLDGENILHFVPVYTDIGFGAAKFYRSDGGEVLE